MSKKEELKRQILQLTREYYNEVIKLQKCLSRAKALLIMAAVTSMMKKW